MNQTYLKVILFFTLFIFFHITKFIITAVHTNFIGNYSISVRVKSAWMLTSCRHIVTDVSKERRAFLRDRKPKNFNLMLKALVPFETSVTVYHNTRYTIQPTRMYTSLIPLHHKTVTVQVGKRKEPAPCRNRYAHNTNQFSNCERVSYMPGLLEFDN